MRVGNDNPCHIVGVVGSVIDVVVVFGCMKCCMDLVFRLVSTFSFLLVLQLPTVINDMIRFLTIPAELVSSFGL